MKPRVEIPQRKIEPSTSPVAPLITRPEIPPGKHSPAQARRVLEMLAQPVHQPGQIEYSAGATGIASRIGQIEMGLESNPGSLTVTQVDKLQTELGELRDQLIISLGETKPTVAKSPEQEEIREGKSEVREFPELKQAEEKYIQAHNQAWSGLQERYDSESAQAGFIQAEIESYVKKSGIEHAVVSELDGANFNEAASVTIRDELQKQVNTLFNSERGRKNPAKHETVTQETNRYLELVLEAQQAGDLPQDLSAETVLRLVEQNIWTLAFQDRIASENMLGDHGIRHLVVHNVRVVETLANELERNGQPVRTVDRLMMHQVMIDHDLGYGVKTVRDQIDSGNFSADRGHGILAAQYERQRAENPNDALSQVFNEKQLQVIHEGVLNHDSSNVNFHVGDTSEAARLDNINSAIHVADNTHAFENKLPELLYAHPDTLRFMRLMKTAGEVSDEALFGQVQKQLVVSIQGSNNFSEDDRTALIHAAESVTPESYRFLVGRICGNNPEYMIDATGKLEVTVEESLIHQEVIGIFGQKPLEQMVKFVADNTGLSKNEVDLNAEHIVSPSGKFEIRVRSGLSSRGEKTDYQQRIEQLINDGQFQEFIIGNGVHNLGDAIYSRDQLNLQAQLKLVREDSPEYNQMAARIEEIKQKRRGNLQAFLEHS